MGLGLSGLATYAFLGITSRALDADAYGSVAVLWSLMFAIGNGVMQPLEQEVARAVSDRRARGIGPGPVIRRAVQIGALFSLGLIALSVLFHDTLLDRFDGDAVLVAALVLGLVGFAASHLARGTLSSHGRFRAYATFFGVDGVARMVLAAALAVAGVAAAGPFGLVLGITPFIGVAVAVIGRRDLLEPGPVAPWGEITQALGWLLLGTGSLSLLIQGGTIAVDRLATDGQEAAAGVFLNGLQVARIPLFLFQAVLASLLPKLSHLAGQGRLDQFAHQLRRLVLAILGLGAVATLGAIVIGPTVVTVVFGSETTLGARDLGLLSAASILIMTAISLDQALIALNRHHVMAVGWFTSLLVFVGVIAMGEDLFLRVEMGLFVGSLWSCAWMGWWLRRTMASPPPPPADGHEVDLAEALAEVPIEP